MTQLVDHCDVLVHEMSYGPLITDMDRKVLKQNVTNWKQIQKEQLEKEKNKQRWEDIKTRTRLWMHSDAEMVGTFASSVHAKKLVVTHFSSRYDTSENSEWKMCFLIAEQVKEYYQGRVDVAVDGLSYTVCSVC